MTCGRIGASRRWILPAAAALATSTGSVAAQGTDDFTLTLEAANVEYLKTVEAGKETWAIRILGDRHRATIGYRHGTSTGTATVELMSGNAVLAAASEPGVWGKIASFTGPRIRVSDPAWKTSFVLDLGIAGKGLSADEIRRLDAREARTVRCADRACPLAPFDLLCEPRAWSKSRDGKGIAALTLGIRFRKEDPKFVLAGVNGKQDAPRQPAIPHPPPARPSPGLAAGSQAWNSAGFAAGLYQKAGASFEDGVRVAAMVALDQEAAASFEALREDLVKRGVIPSGWDFAKEDPLVRGDFAVMLSNALGIEGGVVMRIFGPDRRTATRAAAQAGVVRCGSPYDRITGRELLGTMQRAREWKERGRVTTVEW